MRLHSILTSLSLLHVAMTRTFTWERSRNDHTVCCRSTSAPRLVAEGNNVWDHALVPTRRAVDLCGRVGMRRASEHASDVARLTARLATKRRTTLSSHRSFLIGRCAGQSSTCPLVGTLSL
eukprot:scaffold191774_cov33-Tisochrysis_lutea.AAC.2